MSLAARVRTTFATPSSRTQLVSKVAIAAGVVVILGWLVMQVKNQLFPSDDNRPVVYSETISSDSPSPNENPPDTSKYQVPKDHPRRIIIGSLGIEGLVQKVGLTSQRAVVSPSNVHMAGWYVNSTLPGQKGLSVIDGHVSGRYKDGIFKRLSEAKEGMRFSIELGDRTFRSFEVVAVKQVSEAQSPESLFSKDGAIESQLNLVTCGGKYNRGTQKYADRIIVISKLVG